MKEIFASYSAEIIAALVSLGITGIINLVWRMATLTRDVYYTKKDIDGLGEVIGTERSKSRKNHPIRSK
jgi:hypothetical protein